jgi:hypothetical protein
MFKGFLTEQGNFINEQERYFVLVGNELATYRNDDDFTAGHPPMKRMGIASVRAWDDEGRAFNIVSEELELTLAAGNKDEYDTWCQALDAVMDPGSRVAQLFIKAIQKRKKKRTKVRLLRPNQTA